MGESKTVYTTEPGLLARLLAVLEDWQWARILFHVALIIDNGGWGEVKITLKKGQIDEVSSTLTEKLRQ